MNRRNFLVKGCTACVATVAMGGLLSSCRSTRYVSGNIVQDGLLVSPNEFVINNSGATSYRSFIIVQNEVLQFPICVYRFSEQEYSALWMQCAHQGATLQAAGNILQCPAHGSEFDSRGNVTNGPAAKNLRSFPVTINNNQLFIDLRKT
jgi:Rieske Fe-S protein